MKTKHNVVSTSAPVWIILALFLIAILTGCPEPVPPAEPDEPQTPVPVVLNASIVIAQILSIKPLTNVFPWEVELHLTDSQDVPGYVNLTRERVGQTLTARTKEDMAPYEAGDLITGHLSLAGDEKGTFFYLSNISHKGGD
ncbi:MAG: hypothetical protein DDT30_01675 [Dehalococcoidia bacterium]|nr:hypothetical protein [Bacillota bacterium]